jgi:hypothetical protein
MTLAIYLVMKLHGVHPSHSVLYSLRMMRSSGQSVLYATQCYSINRKMKVQQTSALLVVVAGCAWSTRPIAYAIKVATLTGVATGGTLMFKAGGAGE